MSLPAPEAVLELFLHCALVIQEADEPGPDLLPFFLVAEPEVGEVEGGVGG